MRLSLMLSALFATSLLGGAALAERPSGYERPMREPHLDMVRSHGDVVDRYDRGEARVRPAETMRPERESLARPPEVVQHQRAHGDVIDHSYRPQMPAARVLTAQRGGTQPEAFAPKPPDRQAQRQNCAAVQDDCGGSHRGHPTTKSAHAERTHDAKTGATRWEWKASPTKADAQHDKKSAPQISAAERELIARMLKAKLCAHMASGDGCGGGDE